jgi:putative transposase
MIGPGSLGVHAGQEWLYTLSLHSGWRGCEAEYRVWAYPDGQRAVMLSGTFGCLRAVWNRRPPRLPRHGQDVDPVPGQRHGADPMRKLPELTWLAEVSSRDDGPSARHVLRVLAQRCPDPRFRSGHHKRRPTGARPASRREGTQLRLARIGQCLRVVWTWPGLDPQTLDSSAVSVSCDPAGRWFVVLRADVQEPDPIPTTGDGVGVELGLKDCLVLSKGERIAHPRHMDRYERPWMRFQRILARMPRGSVDRAKATVSVARARAAVCDAGGDFPDRTITDLVGRLDGGALEDLVVANMVKNRKLAKALGGTRWCQFRAVMVYPA